eukprot:6481712-Amphidinium_carterae.1
MGRLLLVGVFTEDFGRSLPRGVGLFADFLVKVCLPRSLERGPLKREDDIMSSTCGEASRKRRPMLSGAVAGAG